METIIQKELLFPEILWERPVHYYKHHGGRIFILAGSKGGAHKAALSCEAVFKSGTGIITLGFPESLKTLYKDFLPDEMALPLPDTYGGSISQKSKELILDQSKSSDAILIGPGISENAETVHLVWELLFKIEKTIVLCDDGITALIKGIDVMRSNDDENFLKEYFEKQNNLILVMSPEETLKIVKSCRLSILQKQDIAHVKMHKSQIASLISSFLNVRVVIIDAEMVLSDCEKVVINKAGADTDYKPKTDLVASVICSFIGQNPEKIFESIATSLYLTGSAIKLVSSKKSQIVSGDVIKAIPLVIKTAESA